MSRSGLDRREFLASATVTGFVSLSPLAGAELPGECLPSAGMLGKLKTAEGKAPIEGATWYVAESEGDGMVFGFPAGTLAKAKYVAADMLLDGTRTVAFSIKLQEGEKGRAIQRRAGISTQAILLSNALASAKPRDPFPKASGRRHG